MGVFDKLKHELIDIIEWLDSSRDTIVWRFPRYENEIKMGAQLIVREPQAAVFINEGRVADAFPPGHYTLQTQNLPILSTLKGWKYGFQSPFKSEVYFVTTRQFSDMKWGTQNPIMVRDPEFGAVRLRAFGGFSFRVIDPPAFLRELAGTDPQFRTDEVSETLRQIVVGRIGSALASANVPMLDLATQQQQIGDKLAAALSEELAPMGVQIPKFIIENISLPEEVEQALDKRSQMGILGDMRQYSQFQAANAMEAAAYNEGGAGEGVGIGLGMAMGQQIADSYGQGYHQQQYPQQPGQYQQAQYPQEQYQQPYGQQPGQYAGPQQTAQPSGQQQGYAQPGAATPPPMPGAEQWYLGANGQQLGPFDHSALGRQVSGGTLTRSTLVWKAGMDQWRPASEVPELAGLLSSTPPPLPPQS